MLRTPSRRVMDPKFFHSHASQEPENEICDKGKRSALKVYGVVNAKLAKAQRTQSFIFFFVPFASFALKPRRFFWREKGVLRNAHGS